jgi:translocation and assembly module TamA
MVWHIHFLAKCNRSCRTLAGIALIFLGCAGCETIQEAFSDDTNQDQKPRQIDATNVADPVDYNLDIDTDSDDALRGLLEDVSVLRSRMDRPPASLASLDARIDEDLGRFQEVLRSKGYYDAQVSKTIDVNVDPVAVTIDIRTGPIFKLTAFEIVYDPSQAIGDIPRRPSDLELEIGQAAAATPLVDAERMLLKRLGENGYPHAEITEKRYIADRDKQAVSATLKLRTGPLTKFGELRITGLEAVEEDYIQRIADWEPGTLYDSREVSRVRSALVNTQLFSSVSLQRADVTSANPAQPVEFVVEEGPPRTVGVGATFASDEEGFGGAAFWEHRNLFGRGERLRISASGSEIRQEVEFNARKPHLFRLDQALIAEAALLRETSDAFDELTASGFLGIQRVIPDHWTVSVGPTMFLSQVEQQSETDDFLLAGMRGSVVYDNRDDALDPTKGIRASVTATPYISLAFTETQFLSTQGTLAGYMPVADDDRVVLAARTRVGSIVGDNRFEVPANLRFYAGGGGSVRGYEFRTIGPLDSDDDPEGALSVVEINTEARIKIVDQFGIVAFLDGGQGFEDELPQFEDEFLWAAGFGLRYYSDFGPFRFDMGFPLNPRDRDDFFQFYVSVGQAF